MTKIRELARSHGGTATDMQVATDTDEWLYRYGEYLGEVAALGVVKFQSEAVSDTPSSLLPVSA